MFVLVITISLCSSISLGVCVCVRACVCVCVRVDIILPILVWGGGAALVMNLSMTVECYTFVWSITDTGRLGTTSIMCSPPVMPASIWMGAWQKKSSAHSITGDSQ